MANSLSKIMSKLIVYILTFLAFFLSLQCQDSQLDIYKNCNVTKGCYGFPSNCTANSNCSVVMTYSGVEEQVYKMELAGKGGEGDYVAMGLSLRSAMGNGTVMACTEKGIDR